MRTFDIVCLVWDGTRGWSDIELNAEYVNILHASVSRNLSVPFNFYCICDHKNAKHFYKTLHRDIWISEMDPICVDGCLPKLEVFNRELGFKDRVIVFDLDTIIVGSIDFMATYTGSFCTRSTFSNGRFSGGDMLGFYAPDMFWLFDFYKENTAKIRKEVEGRERFVYRKYCPNSDFWQRLYPKKIVSYKRHIRKKRISGPPAGARIVSCHGQPRPHVLKQSIRWAADSWRDSLTNEI